MISDKELLNMRLSEVRNKCTNEEMHRWAALDRERLKDEAKKNMRKQKVHDAKAIQLIVEGAKDEFIEEIETVGGAKIKVDCNLTDEQIKMISKFKSLASQFEADEDADISDVLENSNVKDMVCELLATMTPEHSVDEWKATMSEIGYFPMKRILQDVLEPVNRRGKENEMAVKKFRQ